MKNYIFAILFLFPYVLFSQGKIKKSKESLADKNSSRVRIIEDSDENTGNRGVRRNGNYNHFFTPIIEDIAYYAFYGGIIGNSEYRTLTPYPYYNNLKGEYLKLTTNNTKNSLFKIGVNQLFSNSVNALELNANYRVLPILGIEAAHLNFSERSIQGKEYLDISSILVNYYRIREHRVSLWWGAGASYVGNNVDTWGFSYNFGTEIFPFKPISFYTNYKQSFINDSQVNEFKLHLKFHIKNVSLFTGYHANSLGNENVNGLVFGTTYIF